MNQLFAFLTLVAGFVLVMGLVTNSKGTAAVIDSLAAGVTNLFTLELGVVPKKA